ncbi:MAG: adenylate/guanylate cyclase domain-containing protein [Paracoccaceae bacterium]
MDRRLTVILAADLAGYSRLMAADEEGVIRRLRAARAAVIDPALAEAGGRIVKTMGDGLLVEFASPVAAVRAALRVQREIPAREADGPEATRLRFRVGINLGDVVIDGDDVLGDAVNVAARLESLAPEGGICIGRGVFEAARGRIDAEMTPLGPQSVKNLPEPVEVWRVEVEGAAPPKPAARRAERPSIAVLPFQNMSAHPDQEFLADGIVEDVITELSRFRSLMVIARNSTFAYKAGGFDIRKVGEELGARYVVEGSVRRGGDRLRVTAQLIEAATGAHVWAERWDRKLDDLFALQDEMTEAIVSAVEPELGAHERRLARARPTESLTAWELCQRGWSALSDYSRESLSEAERLLTASAEADAGFALPLAMLARLWFIRAVAWGQTGALAQSERWAREALAADDRLETAHAMLGVALAMSGREAESEASIAAALMLNPNSAYCRYCAGLAQMAFRTPDWERMVAEANAALALSPRDPTAHAFQNVVTIGWLIGRMDHRDPDFAASARAAARHPGAPWYVHLMAATAEAAAGDDDAARRGIAEASKRAPGMTLAAYRAAFEFPYIERVFRLGDENGMNERLIALGLPRA